MAINITEDIRDLLYENNLVIIHGFGMIKANYQHAEIRENAGVITPPKYNYQFIDKIQETDHLLEKLIQKKYSLTEEQASLLIEKFVFKVQSVLNGGKIVVIKGIGKFVKVSDGIELNAYEGTQDPISFGLPEVSIPGMIGSNDSSLHASLSKPIKKDIEETTSASHEDPDKQTSKTESIKSRDSSIQDYKGEKDLKSTKKYEPAQSTTRKSEHKDKRKKNFFPWLLGLLILVGFLLVLLSGLYFLNEDVAGFMQRLMGNDQLEQTIDSEVQDDIDTYKKDEDLKSSDQDIQSGQKEQESITNPTEERNCAIMIGYFKDQQNVRKIIDLLERQGFKAYLESTASGQNVGIFADCKNYSEELDFARSNIAKDAYLKKNLK